MPGILERLPDLDSLLQERDVLHATVGDLMRGLQSVDGASSPLAVIALPLGQLHAHLDIDVSGLTEDFPQALVTIRNALPAGSLEFIEGLDGAYTMARDLLTDNPLLTQIPPGSTVQEAALAAVAEILDQFRARIAALTGGLIDEEALDRLRQSVVLLESLRTNYAAHSAELLPFITDQLIGAGPDLLRAPVQHVEQAVSLLVPAQPPDALQAALVEAVDALAAAVETLDPAQASDYAHVQTTLDEIETAIITLLNHLPSIYAQAQAAVELPLWNTLFATYHDLLQAVPIDRVPTVDDLVDEIVAVLEALLARARAVFDVRDLQSRIDRMNATIREVLVGSGITRLRQALIDFMAEIEHAIDQVPTERVQATVDSMLDRVGQEIEALDLDRIGAEIENGFQTVENFVVDHLNDALIGTVQNALDQLLSQVQELPIGRLVDGLSGAIAELQALITDLETALAQHIDTLNGYLAQLEQLSFRPVSDAVITEIDNVKARLQAINPNALSDVEKLAIRSALAVLQALDLETEVIDGLKQGYQAAESQVRQLLNALAGTLNRLAEHMRGFGPEAVLQPVNDVIRQIDAFTDQINGRVLLRPLYDQIDVLVETAESISPANLLTPLRGPYDTMMATVQRLDPAMWVAPLEALYAEIDGLIDFIDITPLLDELDRLQRQWFAEVRATILDALDGLDLPEPLLSFFGSLRPVLEAMTDALFGDPQAALHQLRADLPSHVRLTLLFDPLDAAYDQFLEMLHTVPADDLTSVVNTIREGVGLGLVTLDPRAVIGTLRTGQSQLEALAPQHLLSLTTALLQVQLNFQAKVSAAPAARATDIAAVNARFDAVGQLTAPDAAAVALLIRTHESLVNALRLKINQLDASGAYEAYRRVQQSLMRLLPDFLFTPTPLSQRDILNGFAALRPSAKGARVEAVLDEFLRAIEPLAESLADGTNRFFGTLREVVTLVSPLSIKGAVADVYAALRAKVQILHPDALAAALRENLYDPLLEPLAAFDPALLGERLELAFTHMLTTLSDGVRSILDSIVGVVDERLRAIRAAVRALLTQIQGVIQTAVAALRRVIDRLEQLVFVDILQRLNRVVDNLGDSFEAELDRVRGAFDEMLGAIPLAGSGAARVGGGA